MPKDRTHVCKETMAMREFYTAPSGKVIDVDRYIYQRTDEGSVKYGDIHTDAHDDSGRMTSCGLKTNSDWVSYPIRFAIGQTLCPTCFKGEKL